MIDCTEYERLYPVNEQGKLAPEVQQEMAEHRKTCKNCASFSPADAYFRTRLQTVAIETEAPRLNWFQIKQRRSNPRYQRSFSMRSLSFAAGIAVGVICVSLWINFDDPMQARQYAAEPNQPAVSAPNPGQESNANRQSILADAIRNDNDSSKKKTTADSQRVLHPVPEELHTDFQSVTSGK